jgi:hypothetical protein
MRKEATWLFLWMLTININAFGQSQIPENIFIITLDGLRWQELFMGADTLLIENENFVGDISAIKAKFLRDDYKERRSQLMPWFWSTLVNEGSLLGNRHLGSKVNLTNKHWFSYPGYHEILTGFADSTINSNDKIWNPNKTILEHLNQIPAYQGKVAAFASWDVFPFIINEKRSGVPVNAGFEAAAYGITISEKEAFLNELQASTPSPWASVRLDVFTHHYAKEYVGRKHPKIVYIGYGETDDFAHDAEYDQYLNAANRTDYFIADLWNMCQSDPFYAGKTTFLITTDHGRGDIVKSQWTSHGVSIEGANEIWFAAIGPGIKPLGESAEEGQWYQNQIASTVMQLLGYDYIEIEPQSGPPLDSILKQ